MGAHPLLVIFHDPPSFRDNVDPVTGKRELHNTWLVSQYSSLELFSLTLHTKTDVTKKYIDWAVENGFQVIDVNIPKVVSVDNVSYAEAISGTMLMSSSLARATCGLTTLQHGLSRLAILRCIYGTTTLSEWRKAEKEYQSAKVTDRPYDATQVFFMGIGDAYLGLVDLLSIYGKHQTPSEHDNANSQEQCTEPDGAVELLIGFVAETTIQSIKRTTDDTIANWYYTVSPSLPLHYSSKLTPPPQHSRIFIKNSHYVWDPSRQRKLRRKLGNLVKSTEDSLDTMLESHLGEVQQLLLDKKAEYEEANDVSSLTDEPMQMVGGGSLRSPKMPLLGMFGVGASPKNPMKRGLF